MAVESNVYALWAARQTAKGTPATNGTKRFIQVAGDFNINRDDGSENWSDLDRFGDATDFVNSLIGSGNPSIEAQAEETAYLYWLFAGQETFTAAAPAATPPTPVTRVFTPGTNTGFWSTWWKRVGLSTIVRQKFNDAKISAIRFEASSQNKVAKVTPSVVSLDPGEVFTADPTNPAAISAGDPLLFTEAVGTITIDGVVYSGVSQYAVVIDDAQGPWYGDSVTPYDLVPGAARVTLEGVTLLLDATTLAIYNQQIYGAASPAAGSKPIKTRPALGSFSAQMTRGLNDQRISIKHEVAGVAWSPDIAIPPSPDGGPVEIALAGQMRKVAGQPAWKVTVETGASGAAFSA